MVKKSVVAYLQYGTNVANPNNEDNIISDAKPIQLTIMRASAVELWARGEELHCTAPASIFVSQICEELPLFLLNAPEDWI